MEDRTTSLGEYLIKLGEDPDELKEFLKNPERAMRDAGVPVAERDVIIRGDIEQVHEIVREQLGDSGTPVAFIVHWNWPIVHW